VLKSVSKCSQIVELGEKHLKTAWYDAIGE